MAKRRPKPTLSQEWERISARREKIIDALIRVEAKARKLKRKMARASTKDAKAADWNKGPPTVIIPQLPELPYPELNDPLEIPASMRRSAPEKPADAPAVDPAAEGRAKDDAAREALKAELTASKKTKARGRVAKKLADKAGDTRKMPLSGREAAAFIRDA